MLAKEDLLIKPTSVDAITGKLGSSLEVILKVSPDLSHMPFICLTILLGFAEVFCRGLPRVFLKILGQLLRYK